MPKPTSPYDDTPGIDAALTVRYTHRLRFTHDALAPDNPVLAEAINGSDPSGGPGGVAKAVLAFVDRGVIDAQLDLVERLTAYVRAHAGTLVLAGEARVVPGGEACKNDTVHFETACRAIHDAGLCRHSCVLAIGGGAVLDVVGFAAAACHRGVRLVRMPTTTLAQCDAGVGVKNGVNAFGKKNYLGAFSVPWAVINDERFLSTLCDRDWRCGFSEAVKVAAVKDRKLFERIVDAGAGIARREAGVSHSVLRQSALLHLRHITDGGDPFETGTGRPLDFGHWAAHKLEQMSGYELRHGEAVAIGMAIDVLYSQATGLLPREEAQAVLACLSQLGFELHHESLRCVDQLLHGLEEFREHLGGRLTIPLLTRIGRSVDVHEIDHVAMRSAIEQLSTQPTYK